VGVFTVTAQALPLTTELPGRTVAAQSAEIRPQVSGIVQKRLFTEGSTVRAGQPLYQLDASSYEATVRSAEAAVAKAEATLAAARLTAQRQQALRAADASSQQTVEDAQAALKEDEAALLAAQATLASARIDLARTRITSPIAGRVDTSSVTEGALVTASQTTALTTVQSLDPINVDIPQSSVDLLKLRQQLGQGGLKDGSARIQLVLEDGSTYGHEGTLQVNGVAVNTTRRGDAAGQRAQPRACAAARHVRARGADPGGRPGRPAGAAGRRAAQRLRRGQRPGGGRRRQGRAAPGHGGPGHRQPVARHPGPEGRGPRHRRRRGQGAAGPGGARGARRPGRLGAGGGLRGRLGRPPGAAMAKFFIDRPIFAWVIAILIMLAARCPSWTCRWNSTPTSPRCACRSTPPTPAPTRRRWRTRSPR
jgi:RND family efflux transporter MFP subunit